MKLSRFVTGFVAVALMAFMVSDALGQGRRGDGGGRGGQPGGGFPGRGGGPGGGPGFGGGDIGMMLLALDEVQTELEVSPQQKEGLDKIAEKAREAGAAARGGERPDFGNMSDTERQAFFDRIRKETEARAAEMKGQLEEVLLPQQIARLDEIKLQVRGIQALQDNEVTAKLNVTDDQKKKLAEIRDSQQDRMREMFQGGGGGGGDPRAAFQKLREDIEKETLAVLDTTQQAEFEKMKGEKFDLPEGFGRFGGGGPGGPGGFGRGGGPGGGPGGGGPGGGGPGNRGGRGGRPPAE